MESAGYMQMQYYGAEISLHFFVGLCVDVCKLKPKSTSIL